MSRSAITPSFQASQQSHIEDLVQRNHKHEQTIRQLENELTQEKHRSKTAVQDIQNELRVEKREWREACDTLQACHRIHQLRLQAELEKQRSNVLAEQELLRKEKVATLQREFAITKFQLTETQSERRILELEDELAEIGILHDVEKQKFEAQLFKLIDRLGQQEEHANAIEQAQAEFEAEIDKLRKANAEAHVSSEALSVKLERTTLQLDGERSKIADLERINSELKRSNDELKRQVAKWQSLESKGDSEMEAERKKRVELEVQLQAVQNQLNKREQEFVKAEKKTEKAKQVLDDWKVHAEDLQAQLDELQKKYAAAEKSNGQLLTKVQSLKKVRNTTKSPQKSPLESEEEVAHAVSQAAPSSPAPVPASRTSQREAASKASSQSSSRQTSKGTAARASRSPTVDADAPARTARAKGKGKAVVAERDSDAEAESAQPQKKTRKPRYGPKSKQAPATDDSEVEIISQEDFSVGKKRQAKRKASPLPVVDEEGDEEERSNSRDSPAPAKRRKRNDDPPVQRPPATKKRAGKNAPPSFAESTASTVTVDPEPAGSNSQKNGTTKKRKINLFPSAGKMDLGNLDFGSQGSGIPSILSPLKPEQAVPARSTSFLSLLKR